LKRLSDLGDQLEAFRVAVDFETFRPELNAALSYSDGSQGGRPHKIRCALRGVMRRSNHGSQAS
jgi:hypothetical protein